MSLQNLAHVCSHLQNASLARLGLTSIPFSKSTLAFALLLQRQGFLSHVKLGGASPPASCFAQGPRDDHAVSNYPHGAAGRNPFSSEAALARMIRHGDDRYQLRQHGFPEEAIEFAEQHGRRPLEELEAGGWPEATIKFLMDTRAHIDTLAENVEREHQRKIERKNTSEQEASAGSEAGSASQKRAQLAAEQLLDRLPAAHAALYRKYSAVSTADLHTLKFDHLDLESIAGSSAYVTEREIRRNGITIEAMGLPVLNQAITLPTEEFQDPDGMETEGVVTQTNRASRRLWLGLKYHDSSPVLSKVRMISKPTKRIRLSYRDIAGLVRGHRAGEVRPMTQIGEIVAISTDRGVMEARECLERRIGGLALCRAW